MAESGESSAKLIKGLWAKLVPSESKYSEVEITSNEVVVCSETSSASPSKHQWGKIIRDPYFSSVSLQNLSSNVILVDGAVVNTEGVVEIKSGTEIILEPERAGYLSYRFKEILGPEPSKKYLEISIDTDHAKCCICLNIWHDVVTVAPCLHNFCNGCFSEWLRRSQSKHSSVLCPNCRAVVQSVGRNHCLHYIEEIIFRIHSPLKRSAKELAKLDSYASIKSNLVIRNGKKLSRKRARSSVDDDNDDVNHSCPQCSTIISGFQCNRNTAHLQCHACGGMMPLRNDSRVPQHCLGCDRAFCGAYWHSQTTSGSDFRPLCGPETFKPIAERSITRIPFATHGMNRHEQNITERCLLQTGKPLQDVIDDWIRKFSDRQIDRSRMQLNHAEDIAAGTHLCNECYDTVIAYLLYWFRITFPRFHMPEDAKDREDCWYGYACRTQHHNEEHARKRNHVCRPTRGNMI